MKFKKLQDLVTQLNNIDLDDLQNINYKSLAINIIENRKDILANIILIVFTILYVISTNSESAKQLKNLISEHGIMQKKSEALVKLQHSENAIKRYIKKVPAAIPGDRLIATLNDLAIKSTIHIITYSPGETAISSLSETTMLDITVSALEYSNLWEFMKNLENSEYAIRVNYWSANVNVAQRKRRKVVKSNNAITANIKIIATKIINNEN